MMREQRKGFNHGYIYSDFIKFGGRNHRKALRKAERKHARQKRRKLNKLLEIEE